MLGAKLAVVEIGGKSKIDLRNVMEWSIKHCNLAGG